MQKWKKNAAVPFSPSNSSAAFAAALILLVRHF